MSESNQRAPATGQRAFASADSADDLTDDATRRLLQKRLFLFFSVTSGVASFYGLSPLVATWLTKSPPAVPLIIPLVTLVIGVCNAALALRCRTGQRAAAELHALDAVATATICWMLAGSLTQVRPPSEATISLQLGVTFVLMARAVLLPSSGRRTLAICVLALVPGGLVATWMRVDWLGRTAPASDWLFHGYVVFRNLAVTTFLATLTSKVIYGLRRQVQESARVGQYVLKEKLGEGGMGVVYRATHALLRRDTAVKLLLPTRVSAEGLARFEREVKLTAQLTHPNTVAIFDYGRTPDGVFYYAMECLDGGDLEQLVDYGGPLEPGRAVWILEQVCRALSEAHAFGLVHRDVKPSNVLLCERGREGDVAKILDFGLVKDLNSGDDVRASQNKTLAGTPLYIAPESITAPERVDARSDLYSLGAVAYFLLVGEPPFTGTTVVEVCAAHLHSTPLAPSLRRPGLPAALDAVILRCLAKEPAARFEDALALREALLACALADAWSSARAAAWWRAHRASFRVRREALRAARFGGSALSDTERAATLRIDLQRRDA